MGKTVKYYPSLPFMGRGQVATINLKVWAVFPAKAGKTVYKNKIKKYFNKNNNSAHETHYAELKIADIIRGCVAIDDADKPE